MNMTLFDALASRTPTLFLVIIDNYKKGGVAGDGCRKLSSELSGVDACAPLVVSACEGEEFAADSARRNIQCNDFAALSPAVVADLRRAPPTSVMSSNGGAGGAADVAAAPIECAVQRDSESSVDVGLLLAILLPLFCLCVVCCAIIAIVVKRKRQLSLKWRPKFILRARGKFLT